MVLELISVKFSYTMKSLTNTEIVQYAKFMEEIRNTSLEGKDVNFFDIRNPLYCGNIIRVINLLWKHNNIVDELIDMVSWPSEDDEIGITILNDETIIENNNGEIKCNEGIPDEIYDDIEKFRLI